MVQFQILQVFVTKKNVFGLMPHPERAIEDLLGSTDGITVVYFGDVLLKIIPYHNQI